MKKLFLLVLLSVVSIELSAQTKPDHSGIPPYHILNIDSVYISPANLKKNKPVIIVYFAPDCTHCQHFTMDLTTEMDKESKSPATGFRKAEIVMITFAMLQSVQVFYRDYELAKYPNIIVGTEGYTYFVQQYYQVRTTPYIAVYNRKGKLIQAFDKVPKLNAILAALKKA